MRKTRRDFHKHFIFHYAVKKGYNYIKMMKIPFEFCFKSKDSVDSGPPNNWSKNILVIYSLLLLKSSSN